MKKRILSLALSLVMLLALIPAALADEPQRGAARYSEIIAPQYEDAQLFCEGLAAVKKDGKWGYIDTTGKVVIPFQYDQAYHFNEGKAIVGFLDGQTQDSWYFRAGFIDRAGTFTQFQTADGVAAFYQSGTREVADEFDYVFRSGYTSLPVVLYQGTYTLFGADGEEVELDYELDGKQYSAIPTGPVNEGFAVTFDGYYDLANRSLIYARLDDAAYRGWYIAYYYSFNQGLGPVLAAKWDKELDQEVYALGFVNHSGAWVIQPIPMQLHWWMNDSETSAEVFGPTGLATLENMDGMCGAIDKTGKTVIPFRYEGLGMVDDGLIFFREDGKYGYLDADDLSVVIPAQYEAASSFHSGLAVVYDGTKALLIDHKGDPVPGADKLRLSTYFVFSDSGFAGAQPPDEFVVIEENGKCGYGHVEYLPPLPERDELDAWAYDEVVSAIENGLVPNELQDLYRSDITRGEFCGLVMQAVTETLGVSKEELVQQRTGKALSAWVGEYPFRDTADADIIAASALGIVNGRGDGIFDPYAGITRQEAAALLMRAAQVLGMEGGGTGNTAFTDSGQVDSWAVEAVEYVCRAGIMNGRGEAFDPNGSYSREQSFMTVYRLFQWAVGQ